MSDVFIVLLKASYGEYEQRDDWLEIVRVFSTETQAKEFLASTYRRVPRSRRADPKYETERGDPVWYEQHSVEAESGEQEREVGG